MLRKLVRVALLVATLTFLGRPIRQLADDRPAETLALLHRAAQLEDLRSEGNPLYRLHAHIEVKGKKGEAHGEYGLVWQAPNRWREELKIGDFGRLRVGTDGGFYQVRSVDYQTQMIFDFDKMMDVESILRVQPDETTSRVKSRKINGNPLSCAQILLQAAMARELCFDPASGVHLHAEFPQDSPPGAKDHVAVDYLDVRPSGDKQIPRRIRLGRPGRYTLEISLQSLESLSEINSTTFAEPARSEFWGHCRDSSSAGVPYKKMPEYPAAARQNRQDGFVSIYVRIEPDGSTSHLKTLSATSPAFEGAAREAVQQWKYKPRTCGGSPVRDETVVDVVFWINQ
jgi:TonB family protein